MVGAGKGLACCAFIERRRLAGLLFTRCQRAQQRNALGTRSEQEGLPYQLLVLCQGPFFLHQGRELLRQILAQGATGGFVAQGRFLVLVVRGVPEGQDRVAVQLLVARFGGGLQCLAHLIHFALCRLALCQQQPQLWIVWIAAQQVVQVGVGQGRVILGAGQSPLQVLARIQQPQRADHHPGQQDRQPVRRENGAFNGRGRGSGYARKHRSVGKSGCRRAWRRLRERTQAFVHWLGPGRGWMPRPARTAAVHALGG